MRTGFHDLRSLSVVYCLSASFFIIIECDSCTWPIPTNPAFKKADELGLILSHTVSRFASVAALLWFWWCVFACGEKLFVYFVFYIESTRPTACTKQPCLIYLATTVVMRPFLPTDEVSLFILRPSFACRQKSLYIAGCVQARLSIINIG